jgi:hypothetical protein
MIPGSANPLLLATAAAGGYTISRSLRFNSADSAYLSRTPASAGNRKTWTWAGWVKRSELGRVQNIFRVVGTLSDTTVFQIRFMSNDAIGVVNYSYFPLISTPLYRDTSAWYHIVVVLDTTQATASNRLRFYINGTEITTWATDNRASLTQNSDQGVNQASVAHQIGGQGTSEYFSGYLADIHFIDGQALDPTSFGEFSATTGVWMPKAFTGSYGTNGFKLDFADNSAATAAALGKDTSGNGNNFTPTNLSVTAGAGNDSLIDVPVNGSQTDTGVGGEVRGNYCTLNPLSGSSSHPLANGNLEKVSTSGSGNRYGTIGITSGKFYWESAFTTVTGFRESVGISSNGRDANDIAGLKIYEDAGTKYDGSSSTSYGASWAANDVLGIAFDADNGTLAFYKNGVSQGTAFTGLTGLTWFPVLRDDGGCTSWINFGQRPFAYTAPSGFKALCTANLPAPTIVKPSTVMDVVTYTGNGASSRTISGLGFSPEFIWTKSRSAGYNHNVQDIVRGFTTGKKLGTNLTQAEGDATELADTNGYVSSQTSDGYVISIASGGSGLNMNASGVTYAAWTWDAGSSTVTNTAGTITSSVRASATSGCSVLTYTGNGTSGATIGHGLGVAPSLVIVKKRSASDEWTVYHSALGATKYLWLHATNAEQTGTNRWNNTAPTSSVFSVGSSSSTNGNGATFVAYCFAPVAGYSAFGSWQNNGSTDGTFVYLGFRPRFILLKNSDNVERWFVMDSSRHSYNVPPADATKLNPNTADAEGTNLASTATIDFLSNGFKIRTTNTASGEISFGTRNYIYAAFAESPFQYSRAR